LFREDYKIKNKIGSLLKFQNNDGGFATYNIRSVYALRKKMRMDKGQSYEGWLQSHICVSSVIFYLANISNASITVISKLISFLTSNLSKKNLCYWWTSNIYTLFFLSKSINYVPVDSQLYQILFELFENTINEQHDDGSFGDSYFKNSPFYTGLMVLTIINFKNANSLQLYNNQLNNAVRYLLKSQMEDGSWLQTNAMKLPFPDDIHSFDKNWKVAEFGCNPSQIS
jgi:squalene cyclase